MVVLHCLGAGTTNPGGTRKNGAKEWPDGGTNNGTYDANILEKVEMARAVRSYTDVTREYVNTPLGENRLIISYIIYFINIYLHWVTPGPCWFHTLYQRHGRPRRNQLSKQLKWLWLANIISAANSPPWLKVIILLSVYLWFISIHKIFMCYFTSPQHMAMVPFVQTLVIR